MCRNYAVLTSLSCARQSFEGGRWSGIRGVLCVAENGKNETKRARIFEDEIEAKLWRASREGMTLWHSLSHMMFENFSASPYCSSSKTKMSKRRRITCQYCRRSHHWSKLKFHEFQRCDNGPDRGKSSPSSMYPPIGISDEDGETSKETRDPIFLIDLTIDIFFAIECSPGYEDTRPAYFEYFSDDQNAPKIILKTFRGKMKIAVINRHTTDSDADTRHTEVHRHSLGDALHDVMPADRHRSRIARKQCSSLIQIQTCSLSVRWLALKTTMTSITYISRLSPSSVSSMKKWEDSRDMIENVYVSREEALHDLIRIVIGAGEIVHSKDSCSRSRLIVNGFTSGVYIVIDIVCSW